MVSIEIVVVVEKYGHMLTATGGLLRIPKLKPFDLRLSIDGDEHPFHRPHDMSAKEVLVFIDFLRRALSLDPDHRKTAKELLQHKWLDPNTSTHAVMERSLQVVMSHRARASRWTHAASSRPLSSLLRKCLAMLDRILW
jgi:serine/threonine protein kinase